jgi:cytochrome c553
MKHEALADRGVSRFGARSGTGVLWLLVLLLSSFSSVLQADDPEKFMAAIEKQGVAMAAMSSAEQLYQSCIYCHGKNGNAGSSFYPRLAGQPAGYLKQQLQAYRDGQRQNTIMSSIARILSPEEIGVLADYLSAQTPADNNATSNTTGKAVEQGRVKAKQLACTSCHGSNYQGQGDYPRLAGQGYDYLSAQLTDFRDGQRHDAQGVMAALARSLSDADIENLSRYLSTL